MACSSDSSSGGGNGADPNPAPNNSQISSNNDPANNNQPGNNDPANNAGGDDPDAPTPEELEREIFLEELYEAGGMVDLRVDMEVEDWDRLRHQARSIDKILGPGCDQSPSPSVTTYFPATVSVNGVEEANVGVKTKGFLGSINPLRPSIKVKWNEYEDKDLYGVTHMTFNNNNQDPSALHQCLAYHLFNKAGIPAPRCNLARVHVNGQDMGIYTHLEPIKKPFLRRTFGDDSGSLFEGALSDFLPGRAVTFERKTQKDRDDLDEIQALIDALDVEDDALFASLGEVLDLDAFFRFWVMETMTSHWDGYAGNTNNFYVYKNPETGLLVFLPHGTDGAFQGGGQGRVARVIFASSTITSRLINHPEGKRRFLETFKTLHDEVWDLEELLSLQERWASQVELPEGVYGADNFAQASEELRIFLRSFSPALGAVAELEDLPDAEPIGTEPRCMLRAGTLELEFETAWGTLGEEDPFQTGTGGIRMDSSIPFLNFQTETLGASVGSGEDTGGRIVLVLIGSVSPSDYILLYLLTTPYQVLMGDDIRFHEVTSLGSVIYGQGERQDQIGFVSNGWLSLDEVGLEPGDVWSGRFSSDFLAPAALLP